MQLRYVKVLYDHRLLKLMLVEQLRLQLFLVLPDVCDTHAVGAGSLCDTVG